MTEPATSWDMAEPGGGAATSLRAPSRAAATCSSRSRCPPAPLSRARHLVHRESASGRGGGGGRGGGARRDDAPCRAAAGEDRGPQQHGTARAAVPPVPRPAPSPGAGHSGEFRDGLRAQAAGVGGREEVPWMAQRGAGEAGTGNGETG